MAGYNPRSLSAFLNSLLRMVGFQLVRVHTLERLVSTEQKYVQLAQTEDPMGFPVLSTDDALEIRLAALESRSEKSIQDLIRYAMKAHWRTVDMIDRFSGMDKPDRCPLCGYEAPSGVFNEVVSNCLFYGGRLLRHECPSCNVIFGPQKMFSLDSEMLDLDYRNFYRVYSEGNSTASVIRTFHLLKPTKSGVYLDYGCGGEWSEAIQKLRSDGWNVYGFEPNATHSSEYVFSKWEEVAGKQFTGIFSHNVLEHLFEPIETTRKLSDMLTEGGRLVHATPCFDYRYDFTHYHVFFFTGRSTEVLAEKSGMHIVDWVRDGEYIACTFQKVK